MDSANSTGWKQLTEELSVTEYPFLWLFSLLCNAIEERSQKAIVEGIAIDRFGALVTYSCSSYGIATLMVAVILNRTAVLASTHRLRGGHGQGGYRRSKFKSDLSKSIVITCLRFGAIGLLVIQVKNILTALWVLQKTMDPSKLSRLTMMLPSTFEYRPEDHVSASMGMPRNEVRFGPTSAMLWPVFGSLCFSLFVETFCSSINGDKPYLGGGATLFDLSIGIHEASSSIFRFEGRSVAKRPSEKILILCLFLLVDHIINHNGSMLNRNQYRLIPSTITSLLFVWYFASFVFSRSAELLEFPVFLSLVYLALILVMTVSTVCLAIFLLAVLAKSSSLQELNYASYFWNSEDETDFFSKHLNVSLSQDFYTAMMNIGLFAVSLAGKSSYIKEYNAIFHGSDTWLEDSLWTKIQSQFRITTLSNKSTLVRDGRVLEYLKANGMTGYSNMVNEPSARLVNGTSKNVDETERIPVIKLRFEYLKATTVRFFQLLYSLVIKFFLCHYIPKVYRKLLNGESEQINGHPQEEFELQRSMAPEFLQSVMKQPTLSKKEVLGFSLDNMSEDYLAENYAIILRDKELADMDASPDFHLDTDLELESEYESEVELINNSQARITRGQEYVTPGQTATNVLSEILTPESMDEFLREENIDILRKHLHYDFAELGILTRSRYNSIVPPRNIRDEPTKLLDLLLSKRKASAQKKVNIDGDDDDDDIDPRFACVVCQVSPREVITWPCKCFSICEGCRLSLVSKGMEGCVTCRRDVEGISRVYIP